MMMQTFQKEIAQQFDDTYLGLREVEYEMCDGFDNGIDNGIGGGIWDDVSMPLLLTVTMSIRNQLFTIGVT